MEVLRLSADHRILLELASQLQRNPDLDKYAMSTIYSLGFVIFIYFL